MGRDGGLLRDMEPDLLALPLSIFNMPKPESSSGMFTPSWTGSKERQGIYASPVLVRRFGGEEGSRRCGGRVWPSACEQLPKRDDSLHHRHTIIKINT